MSDDACKHASLYAILREGCSPAPVQASTPSQRWYPPMPSPVRGYAVQAEAGNSPTVIHLTLAGAEAEAKRLARANTGIAFYVQPMYAGKAISKASVSKPVATLEKL